MTISQRIEHLKGILSRHSVKEINDLYRQDELNHVLNSFTAFEDVRYSESMQKRMIKEAKRKRIGKARQTYIQNMIDTIHTFNYTDHLDQHVAEIKKFISIVSDKIGKFGEVKFIHIEHGDTPEPQYLQAYKQFDFKEELIGFETNFNFESIFGFTDKHRFSAFSESLELITLEEEEYPQIFYEIFRLMAYRCVEIAMNTKQIDTIIKELISDVDFRVEIGHHDSRFYTIYQL